MGTRLNGTRNGSGHLRSMPDPQPWSSLRRIVSRIRLLWLLGGFVAGAAAVGWTVAKWEDGRASTSDVQLIANIAENHDRRLIRLETDLGWIKQTLYEMARRVGLSPQPPPQ